MDQSSQTVRVRFAPSPTGDLHIGGLRVALFNWLFARQQDGKFIIRIEDTDQARYKPESVRTIVEGLHWAGLDWDEGPVPEVKSQKHAPYRSEASGVGSKVKSDGVPAEKLTDFSIHEIGDNGPYFQSQRTALYQEHAKLLLEKGMAYHCFCSPERLEEMRKQQEAQRMPPMYDKHCVALEAAEVQQKLAAGTPYVIRLKVPHTGTREVNDLFKGSVSFDLSLIDDQVLIKSDGFPTYHLAVVVDDHHMGVTHVFRGEDWLPSTAKHILLYEAFGWEQPLFGHLPLILAEDKTKLSKRHGAVSVLAFRDAGYLPEALLNFTLFLGWNPGKGSAQELFTKDEMVRAFSLEGIQKSPAVFNYEKLKWFNAQYIKQMSDDALLERLIPLFLTAGLLMPTGEGEWRASDGRLIDRAYLTRVAHLLRPRLVIFDTTVCDEVACLFSEPSYPATMLVWKKSNAAIARTSLTALHAFLSAADEHVWDQHNGSSALETMLKEWIARQGYATADILWPMRVALSGAEKSPSPFELSAILGKVETLKRLSHAITLL